MPLSSEHRGRAGREQPEPRVQARTLVHAAHTVARTWDLSAMRKYRPRGRKRQ